MGYRSDVRIITTKEGFEEIRRYVNKAIEENGETTNIMKTLEIHKEIKDLIYLGWNNKNSDTIDLIQAATIQLKHRDITYRLMTLGEYLEEKEEYVYTSKKDANRYIPHISIIRTFDEQEIERSLNVYSKEFDKTNKDEMEMENSE